MAALHLIAGKAGAGKTTLARRLAQTLPAIAICEDEWMAKLAGPVENLEQYLAAARRIRSITGPLATELLTLGTSVVFDFGGNTRRERLWVRSLCEPAGSSPVLHYIQASDDVCRQRVLDRNASRPVGLYFGDVTIEQLDEVNRFFEPPTPDEGFEIVPHVTTGFARSPSPCD
jgi:predicted kinase